MTDVARYLGIAILAFVLSPQPAVAQTEDAHDEVTFSKDIAPILQRSCQKCHRPNSLAPMSLIAYEEVRPLGSRDQVSHRVA